MPDTFRRAWNRMRVFVRWRHHDRELADEIALHEEMKRDALIARGMSPHDATNAARRAMGNVTAMREDSRSVWRFTWLRDALQDFAYGARMLRRNPGFAVVAILGLAFGLGFSAAVFTGFNAFALRGWEIREADRMVALSATYPTRPQEQRPTGFSLDEMRVFSTLARTTDGVIAYVTTRPDGTGDITAAPVSGNYFDVLGVPIVRGRGFVPEEDQPGAPQRVIVVSHRYWTTTLRSRSDVIGSSVRVTGVPFTVIGVARPGFDGTGILGVDAWIPLASMPIVRPRDEQSRTLVSNTNTCCIALAARLAPGVSRDAAAAELSTLVAARAVPGVDSIPRTVTALPFSFAGTGGVRMMNEVQSAFLLIGGGVAAVMLLACANVANLLLARATARKREIGIRLALGASRSRIVRQLMVESLMLATLASIPALVIASWTPGKIVSSLTDQVHTMQFTTDWNILFFTVVTAIICCVLFGLAPALHASKLLDAQRHRLPLRSVFLSAQVTFCVILLVSAGLFVRSARIDRTVDLGFVTDGITELRIKLPADVEDANGVRRLQRELPELAASVGARNIAFSESPPFFTASSIGYRVQADGDVRGASLVQASPEYFTLLEIGLVAGRLYRADDVAGREVVVNPRLAEELGDPDRVIGSTLLLADGQSATVVGITRPTHDVGLREIRPAVYRAFPWTMAPRIVVRENAATTRALYAAIMARDPSLIVSTRSYAWYAEQATSSSTFAAVVAGLLGMLALVLASIGMFGVLSYWVQQREHEIGVRVALGATPAAIVRLVVGASGRAIGWGLLIGLIGAIAISQLLRSSLFGLNPLDPASYAGAMLVLVLSAGAATVLPIWRAMRVDPMQALRAD